VKGNTRKAISGKCYSIILRCKAAEEKKSIIKFKVEKMNNVVISSFTFKYTDASLKIKGLKKNIIKACDHLDFLFEVRFDN
jgi:hypothetical protein